MYHSQSVNSFLCNHLLQIKTIISKLIPMNLNNEVYLHPHCLKHLVFDMLAYHLYVFTVRRICESETFRFLPFTACSTLEQSF